ncbi:MAG TPA: DUF4331 family protein [Myxococcales bacterium]|nr:DUF4331 family protein [Myxococcales bacterium]
MAADHADGPAATADPSVDITDVFAWTSSDGKSLNLAMDVFPSATTTSKFSNTAQYVFHTSSTSAFGTAATSTENIICTFDASQKISCWAGSEYVNGDASPTAGISSSSGKLKVFAGLREDPFFFNIDGFHDAVADVIATAAANKLPTPDAAGCYNLGNPATTGTIANAVVADLTHTSHGAAAPVDHFAGLNVLSIVLTVDLSIVNAGGSVVSAWASTNRP